LVASAEHVDFDALAARIDAGLDDQDAAFATALQLADTTVFEELLDLSNTSRDVCRPGIP
jgi:hypothetical protein